MEIKVGQWVRTSAGHISKVIAIPTIGKGTFKHIEFLLESGLQIVYADKLIAVANDPRELIQVGDLVEFNSLIGRVRCIVDNKVYTEQSYEKSKNILAIYTPNKDKTQYTEQWRANE